MTIFALRGRAGGAGEVMPLLERAPDRERERESSRMGDRPRETLRSGWGEVIIGVVVMLVLNQCHWCWCWRREDGEDVAVFGESLTFARANG